MITISPLIKYFKRLFINRFNWFKNCCACLWPTSKTICNMRKKNCMKSFAASIVQHGLICLKFAKIIVIIMATFLTCFWNVSWESKMTPKYLKSETILSFSPLTNTSGWGITVGFCEKYIQTVLLVLKCKYELLSQSETWTNTSVWMFAACCLFLACTYRTVSSAYIWILTDEQTSGKSFIYKLNRIGHRIDPWGTPMLQFQYTDWLLPRLMLCFLFAKQEAIHLISSTEKLKVWALKEVPRDSQCQTPALDPKTLLYYPTTKNTALLPHHQKHCSITPPPKTLLYYPTTKNTALLPHHQKHCSITPPPKTLLYYPTTIEFRFHILKKI